MAKFSILFVTNIFIAWDPPSLLAKVKAISLQAWTGPEGYRRLRLSHFKTIGT